jgi:hypothetical protein
MSDRTRIAALATGFFVSLGVACADGGPEPIENSPMAGLIRVTGVDSGTTTPPPAGVTPGYFRGTVRGYSNTNGPDTAATAVLLPNVRVTAYPRIVSSTDTLGVGPAAGTTLTSATGEWQLPTMPGGEYVVTFNPQAPQDTQYRGAWTVATVHAYSHESPWYIMLPPKN